jgi:hypothetical protein
MYVRAEENAGGYSTAKEAGNISHPRTVNTFIVPKKNVYFKRLRMGVTRTSIFG